MMKIFKNQISKGIELNILTNSLSSTDAIVVYGAWERYRNQLVRMGANVYEIRNDFFNRQIKGRFSTKHSLHGKTIVFDDNLTLLGSFNIDPRSAYINTGAVLFDKRLLLKGCVCRLKIMPNNHGIWWCIGIGLFGKRWKRDFNP